MRSLALAVVLSLALAPAALAKAPHCFTLGKSKLGGPDVLCGAHKASHPLCKKGKPCGDSCIAKDKVCHKG